MKLFLLPALLLVFPGTPRDRVEIVFAPVDGTVLKRAFVAEAEYRLADERASIDGEAVEAEEMPTATTGFTERIVVTDALETVGDGRPTEFVRTFDELHQENTETFEEEEASQELSSPLRGRALRYTYDADAERYSIEPDDDGELDEDLADSLAADMDLLLLLPGREVEPGDEWEVDPRLYLAFMWPGGLLDFHVEGEDVSEEERALSRQTIERLEGTGKARLEEVRDEDGRLVAVIHLELEIRTGSENVEPAREEGDLQIPEITHEVEIERTLEGTVLWDLEHDHARSVELECRASRLHARSWTAEFEADGEVREVEVETARLHEGTIRYTATIERQ